MSLSLYEVVPDREEEAEVGSAFSTVRRALLRRVVRKWNKSMRRLRKGQYLHWRPSQPDAYARFKVSRVCGDSEYDTSRSGPMPATPWRRWR